MAYLFLLFQLRGNLDFPEFLQKSFTTSTTAYISAVVLYYRVVMGVPSEYSLKTILEIFCHPLPLVVK